MTVDPYTVIDPIVYLIKPILLVMAVMCLATIVSVIGYGLRKLNDANR